MARKSAKGAGTIRKKTVFRNGKQYVYWEARYTVGRDLGTGKQIQRSITGRTQKEVSEKLRRTTTALDDGTYIAPCDLTLSQWLNIWISDYSGGRKPSTIDTYMGNIKKWILPALGAVKLHELTPHMIQRLYNNLSNPNKDMASLSPSTIRIIHAILHSALKQAVRLGYIRFNPTESCILPRKEKKEIRPLTTDESRRFLQIIQGHRFRVLFTVALFTGMREGELLGLSWNNVDFINGTIRVVQQLHQTGTNYTLTTPKSGKARTISPAPWVMKELRRHRAEQSRQRLQAGELWTDNNAVFSDGLGNYLSRATVYGCFKRFAVAIGRPDARFHDLRHTYAVTAIQAGDDIKTIQQNLGHATAAFTLDVYGHVTDQMLTASAQRMENYIKNLFAL